MICMYYACILNGCESQQIFTRNTKDMCIIDKKLSINMDGYTYRSVINKCFYECDENVMSKVIIFF